MNTINRLQLRHHTPVFETREDAIEYIYSQIRFAEEGLAFDNKDYGFSLLGEPTVLLYKNVTEEDPTGEDDPHLIFVIGSATNDSGQYSDNRFCIIDIDKTEKEIEDLWDALEKAIRSLTIFTRDTNTLKLYSEKTEDGTIISGDVVVATSQIFDDARKPNIILSTDDGLFTYVNMEYDNDTDKLTFTVNGDTKEWFINNNHLVGGSYSKEDESLHLKMKDETEIVISFEELIDEWDVEGEASNTPIVLTKERIGYGDDAQHNHVEPWQDVLRGDVRLADRRFNILKKTSDGRYLYVDGLANNITYFKDGEEISVQEALSQITNDVSNDSTNIIYEKTDGYFATASLKYANKENKLIFTTSNVTGGTTVEEIKLNSVEAFKKIYYDASTETIVIMYIDGNGDVQECDVPIGEMMIDWEWDIVNDGHDIKLHKQRVIGGNDKVSADAAISDDPDNILVDKNHELFVKGTADNIKYGRNSNVSDELDKLNANDADINARLNETSGKVDTLKAEFDAEVERATGEEQRIEDKLDNEISRSTAKDTEHDTEISTIEQTIGDGFSTDGHETVTYRFNELSAKTNTISAKTDAIDANLGLLSAKTEAEIVRATSEEQRIEKKFDDALGEGFDIRNTVRDEFNKEKAERVGEDARLQTEIDSLSANTESRLIDVINLDHSIDVDKTDAIRPVISVNLSDEQIEGMQNVIKLNNDGLYAGVDLDYYFESGTSKNVLVFKTTNGTKTFDLKTNSVVDKIYYDPTREAIIIEYTVDGHRMPDVVVPVHDLINEWRVSEDTNGAIKLYKFRESGATQDVLYAESIISNHDDNILINDNGSLYVSGAQIEQNKADIAALAERVDATEADIEALDDGLAAEITRATSEEQRIEEKLDREIERSTTEDDNLWEALRAEIARSTEKDNEHDAEIAEEIQRAMDAEHALHDEISAETTARISADTALNTKIDNEISRSTNEEQRIDGKLNDEITRSTAKDTEHDTKIQQLRTDLEEEIDRASQAEDALHNEIVAETNRATSAETALDNRITNVDEKLDREISRSTAKDTEHDTKINELRTDLTNEIADRTNADTNLSDLIHQEEDRAKTAESAITHALEVEILNRQSGDTTLNQKIDNEISSARTEEQRIEARLNEEITRSTNKDSELETAINNETSARMSADSAIQDAITAEQIARISKDAELQQAISTESARSISEEARIETKLDREITRSTNEDTRLNNMITAETANRIAADEALDDKIDSITLTFEDSSSVDFNNPYVEDNIVKANVKLQEGDNIIKLGQGLYASVHLSYDPGTNKIKLVTSNGDDEEIQLVGASLLENLYYDSVEKELVITYKDAAGEEHTVRFGVEELFNDWIIQNPSEKSALELVKTPPSAHTQGSPDVLHGRVLITDDHDGDGKPDQGSPNIIEIRNNGLFVDGTPISAASATAECVKEEIKAVERAVFGQIAGDCGEGFVYQPMPGTTYINTATTVNNATFLLDLAISNLSAQTEDMEEDIDCLKQGLSITQQNVLGFVMPPCGMNGDNTPYHYPSHVNSCFISAATNMDEADVILDSKLCEVTDGFECISAETKNVETVLGVVGSCDNVINYPTTQGCLLSSATTFAQADLILEEAVCRLLRATFRGSERVTTSTKVVQDPYIEDNKIITVDVRLSHGNEEGKWQTDEELTITSYSGDCIETVSGECASTEFTDTNVLRIVDLTERGYREDAGYNGLYLSNVWNCGQYTENGVGTPGEKYKIDDSPTAENYYDRKYRNGRRYHNG